MTLMVRISADFPLIKIRVYPPYPINPRSILQSE
jgi:hypothetical protein